MIEILLFKCQVFSPCQIWPLHFQRILNNIHPQWMVTIRNVLTVFSHLVTRHPFLHSMEGWRMRDDEMPKTAGWDAENLAMANVSLSYQKVIFISSGNISKGANHRLGFCFSLQSLVIFKRNLLEIVLFAFDKKLWTKKSMYLVMNMANAQELSGRVWT